MGVLKIRNNADDGWIELGGIGTVYQSDSEPATPHAGQLWLDTDDSLLASGALIHIETIVASGDASLIFTDLGGYSKLQVIVELVVPVTDDVVFTANVSNDNGSTWLAGTYYWGTQHESSTVGGHNINQHSNTAAWALHYQTGVGSAVGEEGISGTYKFYGFNDAALITHAHGDFCFWTNAGRISAGHVGLRFDTALALDAIKFAFTSGNVESGKISVYGIKES